MMPNNILQILEKINPNIKELQGANTPEEVAQMLLNSGRVNQAQVNQAKQLWNQPQVRQMIQNKFGY
jgi:hypothetical protein